MFFHRLYEDNIAQASYLIGCEKTRDAIVIDPTRDIDRYLSVARSQKLHIRYVTETHIHADFASGSRALAASCDAKLLLSGEGGSDWQYRFASEADAHLLRNGNRIEVGRLRIDVLHTPGHTPEHLTFLVTDLEMGGSPVGAVTGDFLFVGDVGRPDLLERAAGYAGSMESAARTLHASLRAFREQPDHLQIWPGHGAGSACGKSLGAMPHSTLGFEKMFNWALQPRDEEDFVQEILTGQPAPPRYFARMKVLNRDEQFLDPLPATPRPLEPSALPEALRKNAQVVDLRPASQHATRHVRGTLSIPMNKSFANWAGALLNYDEPVYLLAEDATGKPVADATRAMGLIGMDSVAGVFDPRALDAAERAGLPAAQSAEVSTSEVRKALDSGFTVIDVRNANEWIEGHIPGAIHIPLAALPAKLSVIPDGPVVVHCQSGGRAWIAASVLERAGLEDVHAYSDGFAGWKREGQPVEREDEALSASSAQKK